MNWAPRWYNCVNSLSSPTETSAENRGKMAPNTGAMRTYRPPLTTPANV